MQLHATNPNRTTSNNLIDIIQTCTETHLRKDRFTNKPTEKNFKPHRILPLSTNKDWSQIN